MKAYPFYILLLWLLFSLGVGSAAEIKYVNAGGLFTKSELDLYMLKKMVQKKDYRAIGNLIRGKQAVSLTEDLPVEVLKKDPRTENMQVRVIKTDEVYWTVTTGLKDEAETVKNKCDLNLNAVMVKGTVFEENKFSEVVAYLREKTKSEHVRFATEFDGEDSELQVSMVFADLPLPIFLKQLCKESGLKYKLEQNTITFYR